MCNYKNKYSALVGNCMNLITKAHGVQNIRAPSRSTACLRFSPHTIASSQSQWGHIQRLWPAVTIDVPALLLCINCCNHKFPLSFILYGISCSRIRIFPALTCKIPHLVFPQCCCSSRLISTSFLSSYSTISPPLRLGAHVVQLSYCLIPLQNLTAAKT
jgi:hypothetical protein